MSTSLFKDDSTGWTPLRTDVNEFSNCHIIATGPQYSSVGSYGPNFVTGSTTVNTKQYSLDLGFGPTVQKWLAAAGTGYLGDTNPAGDPIELIFDMDRGTGYTASLDSFFISCYSNNLYCGTGFSISASNDTGSGWTGISYSSYGTNTQRDDIMSSSNDAYYRWYSVLIITGSAGSGYRGVSKISAWDSKKAIGNNNLLNPLTSNVTGSFKGASGGSLIKLTSPQREAYGWYLTSDIGSLDLSWGDGKKLVRGMSLTGYSSTIYFPGKVQIYASDTGNYNDWTLVSTIDITNSQYQLNYSYYAFDFGTPIYTQHLRLVVYEEGSTTSTSNLATHFGSIFELNSVVAPPTPTDLEAISTSNTVSLKWTQNSGSDNRLEDLFYNVEISDDAGSSYTIINTISGSEVSTAGTGSYGSYVLTNYVDFDRADGDYLYRVQAQNMHHKTTGSYVTSDSITLPVAAAASKKIYITNKGNVMINPNDTTLLEL